MPLATQTTELLDNLARRPGHDQVKASFRQLLNTEFAQPLDQLDLEVRAPVIGGRLDALVGRTVFEAKRNLKTEWEDVRRRMPDYLADREREYQARFIGLAADGADWIAVERDGESLVEVSRFTLEIGKPDNHARFLAWLDGTLALKAELFPDAITIRMELGEGSLAFRTVRAAFARIWPRFATDPTQALKRRLWADLLAQVYGRTVESDDLWFQHSYLVVVAKCIALAVMDVREDDPARLLSGEAFTAAGIQGAVESDFFDWMLADPEGVETVRKLVAHVRRFRLAEVETDVLKILYESLIDREQRHGLGEYYTPDWLAAKIVRHAVDRPLEQRVLDPACGSGTFLFHAVRRALAEAADAGIKPVDQAREASRLVAGLDIHPVAVIIARVTYLLALAPALKNRSGALSIPVYLGDSLQLSVAHHLNETELRIAVPPPPAGAAQGNGHSASNGKPKEMLIFPETFCRDPELFDKAIERMRTASLDGLTQPQVEAALVRITEQHYKTDLTAEQAAAIRDLGKTFALMDRLRKESRDTIWAYVARNLSRPLAFASGGGWANVLVGNPPWVAFRHMSDELQKAFREMAKGEKVYVGGRFATQNDLCALFTVRASHLYLRPSGRLAFVLPLAALTRGQFEKFRTGRFGSDNIAWDEAWTMDDGVTPLFPVPSCVVFGRKRAIGARMPETVRAYAGTLPRRDASEAEADARLEVLEGTAPAIGSFAGGSPYRAQFKQGAILVPRLLCLVYRKHLGRLGADPSAPLVESLRSPLEKKPWKSLPHLSHQVEAEFLRPILLGEHVLPYRILPHPEGVIPSLPSGVILTSASARSLGFDKLAGWLTHVERVWNDNRSPSTRLEWHEQIDFYGKLSAQFPIRPLRIVYAASGTLPAACLVRDDRAVIEHKLYWAAPETEDEAHYLAAILNSETARARAEKYQSRGQFGARDFDKVMFNLPIPRFEASNPLHQALAAAAAKAEALAATVEIPETTKFQRARRLIRTALADAGISDRIDAMVAELLDTPAGGKTTESGKERTD